MRITSGMASQSGGGAWSRLARINKWGNNNTSSTAWPVVFTQTMRVTVNGGGFNTGGISCVVLWKVWTDTNGTPRSALYSDQPSTRGLVLGVEDTGTYWQLVVSGTPTGSVVEVETLTASQPGFLQPRNNEPFTYTPVGPVGKPFWSGAQVTPSSNGTANQYVPIATIVTDTAYQRYSGTFSISEMEGSESFAHIVSVLINQSAIASPPTVQITEITDFNRKSTLFFYTLSTTNGVSTITLWAQSTLTYSSLAVSLLTEAVNASTLQPKVLLCPSPVWQAAAPSGLTRISATHATYSPLSWSNGWGALSGYNTANANGLFVVNRIVTFRLVATGGTTLANGSTICSMSNEWKPQNPLMFHGVGFDSSGNSYPVRLAIATTGVVTLVGTTNAAVTSIVADATWETYY